MVQANELTSGLKRLLRLCPNITLDTRSIQLIVDGKINQVIAEYNKVEIVEDDITTTTQSTDEIIETITYSDSDSTINVDFEVKDEDYTVVDGNEKKAFDEYFPE